MTHLVLQVGGKLIDVCCTDAFRDPSFEKGCAIAPHGIAAYLEQQSLDGS